MLIISTSGQRYAHQSTHQYCCSSIIFIICSLFLMTIAHEPLVNPSSDGQLCWSFYATHPLLCSPFFTAPILILKSSSSYRIKACICHKGSKITKKVQNIMGYALQCSRYYHIIKASTNTTHLIGVVSSLYNQPLSTTPLSIILAHHKYFLHVKHTSLSSTSYHCLYTT